MTAGYGKTLAGIRDPAVRMELDRIHSFLEQRLVKLDKLAASLAPLFKDGAIAALERFFEGAREGRRLVLRQTSDDAATLEVHKGPGTKAALFLDADTGFTANFVSSTPGAVLTNGGAWQDASSRKKKRKFKFPDIEELVARIRQIPVLEWEYKREPGKRRLGPLAEDWLRVFRRGDGESLSAMEVASLALIGVQWILKGLERCQCKTPTGLEESGQGNQEPPAQRRRARATPPSRTRAVKATSRPASRGKGPRI